MESQCRDNMEPELSMEEGRGVPSPIQDLGVAESTARTLNYPDVIFEGVEGEVWSSPSTEAGAQQQQQAAYLWPEFINGKFFSVDQTALKMLVAGTYQFGQLLGAGAYSWVVEGVNLNSGEVRVQYFKC